MVLVSTQIFLNPIPHQRVMANEQNVLPEERLRKLKEKQKEIEKSMAEVKKQITASQQEVEQEQIVKEKIPIPQLTADSLGQLTTAEEKMMFKAKRFVEEKTKEPETTEKKEISPRKSEESIEQLVEGAPRRPVAVGRDDYRPLGQEQFPGAGEYLNRLSQQPAQNLYTSLAEIEQDVMRRGGYVTEEERRNVQYISSAMEQKLDDAKAGDYTLTEEVARMGDAVHQMRDALLGSYKRSDSGDTQYMRAKRY